MASIFFTAKHYAVVGASTDPAKFGNRVLRWYQSHLPEQVTPINPKEKTIEGLDVLSSIKLLPDPTTTSISVITPPAVTLGVVKEALDLGINAIWLQPGSEDTAVKRFVAVQEGAQQKVILGGPCILVLGAGLLDEEKRRAGKL
ncbi:hypothetical protein MNV49_000794 [Pseudohyphozyma bogoriensis]|nr:hypothetical protein MNV49_000794 [Pseudohyphozyma bogoriensis]